MKPEYKKLINVLGEKRVQLNEPLANHTYMKVGGPADLFYLSRSVAELIKAVKAAIELKVPYFILGGGSNILVGDKGMRALVIKNRADKIAIKKFKGKIKNRKVALEKAGVIAESGVITNLLVRTTIDAGLAGLEYFLGVPGTIGGAVYNNSHFKSQLLGNCIEEVRVLDREGNQKTYTKEQMQFAYDYSILQETKEIALAASFLLKGSDPKKLWKKAEQFARYRSQTQPLNFPSSGCIFKNVGAKQGIYGQENQGLTSAGYLIEAAGLKGTKVGGAEVSQKHASFIINTGGATAAQIIELIKIVKKKVKAKFGVELELEVFKVGEFS